MKLIILALITLQTTSCNYFEKNNRALILNPTQSEIRNVEATKASLIAVGDTTLQILTYGLPFGGPSAMASRDVAKKFGFRYYPVAGCMVTEELLDSVKKENDRTYQTISTIHGKEWQVNFNQQVAGLSKQYERAIRLAEKDAVVISKTKEGEKQEQYISLDAKPGSSENMIEVEAYSFRWTNNKNEKIVHLRLSVDLKKSQVTIIDNIEKVYEL